MRKTYTVQKYNPIRDSWIGEPKTVDAHTFIAAARQIEPDANIYGTRASGCFKGQRTYEWLSGLLIVVKEKTETQDEARCRRELEKHRKFYDLAVLVASGNVEQDKLEKIAAHLLKGQQ